mgnify:FL=1
MNRIVLVSVFYFFILLVAAVLPDGISDYNAYVVLLISVLYALMIKSADVYLDTLICGAAVCVVSIFQYPLYAFLDCILIFFVFASLYIGACFPVKIRELRFIQSVYLFVCLASVVGIFSPALYKGDGDEMRYAGLFHAINFSACVFSILGIAVWEIEKRGKERLGILLLMVVCFFIYTWATSTRSLLFVLPYWIYQLFGRRKTKVLVVGLFVVGLFYLPSVVEQISEKLRLEDNESSMATRSVLYLQLLSGILDNYAFIPHGSYAATDMIIRFTNDSRYSPHNDFLNFIYNWGAIFYVFCLMVFVRLKRCVHLNAEFILILLAMASCALHNMMFAVYVWIPFTIILMARRTANGIGKICYE